MIGSSAARLYFVELSGARDALDKKRAWSRRADSADQARPQCD
jgi:hypothetical protein